MDTFNQSTFESSCPPTINNQVTDYFYGFNIPEGTFEPIEAEMKIESLEKRNKELEAQIMRLKVDLEKKKMEKIKEFESLFRRFKGEKQGFSNASKRSTKSRHARVPRSSVRWTPRRKLKVNRKFAKLSDKYKALVDSFSDKYIDINLFNLSVNPFAYMKDEALQNWRNLMDGLAVYTDSIPEYNYYPV